MRERAPDPANPLGRLEARSWVARREAADLVFLRVYLLARKPHKGELTIAGRRTPATSASLMRNGLFGISRYQQVIDL
jgi:hypothetical protein